MYGFFRVAIATPNLRISDVEYNTNEIIKLISQAENKNATAIVFPELSLTSYSCGDLFFQAQLLKTVQLAIKHICKATAELGIISVVGAPLLHFNKLYNCAVIIHQGEVIGVIPKSYLANYKEYSEKRFFSPGHNLNDEIEINGEFVPFGDSMIFQALSDSYFSFGIEIGSDLQNIIPPSSYHCIAGANIIFNLSAINFTAETAEKLEMKIINQSSQGIAAYCFAATSSQESTTDLIFQGKSLIVENGEIMNQSAAFCRKSQIIYSDIDCEKLANIRLTQSFFNDNAVSNNYQIIHLGSINKPSLLQRKVVAFPFIPENLEKLKSLCESIITAQKNAIAKRLEHLKCQKTVIGISGGLDSTLALLALYDAYKILKIDVKNIITVTMPGFGTSTRTHKNAEELCKNLKTTFREISIKDACLQHFKDIKHSTDKQDVVYENTQARERTQILMDIANQENGIVIGTGDLSEIALGWCTFNGDHISMYNPNCSIPKTLMPHIVKFAAKEFSQKIQDILTDILATPISPELLPPCEESGEITHKTEEKIGPYEVHDFFLYHTILHSFTPEKICFMATEAFQEKYTFEQIVKFHNIFISRFFSQQFKRNCSPDGPKISVISLSPRNSWQMPSDAFPAIWQIRTKE